MKLFVITLLITIPLFVGVALLLPKQSQTQSTVVASYNETEEVTIQDQIIKTENKPHQFKEAQKLRDKLNKIVNSRQGSQMLAMANSIGSNPISLNPFQSHPMGNITITLVDQFKKHVEGASNNNVNAQYMVGISYKYGLGTVQNFNEAERWFKTSSKRGSAAATYEIGVLYFHGLGKSVNYETALSYYQKSAIAGNKEAIFSLAEMYNSGFGTAYNPAQADFWYDKIKPWYKLSSPITVSIYHERYGY